MFLPSVQRFWSLLFSWRLDRLWTFDLNMQRGRTQKHRITLHLDRAFWCNIRTHDNDHSVRFFWSVFGPKWMLSWSVLCAPRRWGLRRWKRDWLVPTQNLPLTPWPERGSTMPWRCLVSQRAFDLASGNLECKRSPLIIVAWLSTQLLAHGRAKMLLELINEFYLTVQRRKKEENREQQLSKSSI